MDPDPPAAAAVAAPPELDGEALLEWGRVCAELRGAGRPAESIDRAALTLWCQTWATWAGATAHVARFGPVIKWPNGLPGPSPYYRVARECLGQLRGMAEGLGLTPGARARFKPAGGPAAPADADGEALRF